MWKDWFYFSRRERNGTIVIVLLMLFLLLLRLFWPKFEQSEPFDYADYIAKIDSFKQVLYADSIRQIKLYEDFFDSNNLKPFDPNTCDSSNFSSLGFGLTSIKNIKRYRTAGGKFSKPEDLKRIYSISDSEYSVIKPFILIEETSVPDPIAKPKFKATDPINKPTSIKTLPVQTLILDLNSVDTSQLKTLKGIGDVYALRIIKYREWLGGFYSLDQLNEVYGLNQDIIAKIKPHLKIDNRNITKININTASVAKMKNHPYLNFYQAKSIYEYKKRKGEIVHFDELFKINAIDTSNFYKAKHYISFSGTETNE